MVNKKEPEEAKVEDISARSQVKYCGVVMPIAAMLPEYTEAHWKGVLKIIEEATKMADFTARLVSESETSNIIQKDIVQNLYKDEIVICDVSGRNPNVMFELGLRLAFDKPTIIIKDTITDYSFDISPIKHIPYPKDLNYHSINKFKIELSSKITGSLEAVAKDPKYSVFLQHFKDVQIKPATLEKEEISMDKAVIKQLEDIQNRLDRIDRKYSDNSNKMYEIVKSRNTYEISNLTQVQVRNDFINFYRKSTSASSDTSWWFDAFMNSLNEKYTSIKLTEGGKKILYDIIDKEISNLPF